MKRLGKEQNANENKVQRSKQTKRTKINVVCICMAESLHCSPETLIRMLIRYTPI